MVLDKISIFLFVWITSFLIHEVMHIKSQGLKSTGIIGVHQYGFTASVNHMENSEVFYYAGGVYTSIIMSLCALLSIGWWSWCFITLAWVQLCYGIYEGYNYGDVDYRYIIYIVIPLIMLIFWFI